MFQSFFIFSSAAFFVLGSVFDHSAITEAGVRYKARNFFVFELIMVFPFVWCGLPRSKARLRGRPQQLLPQMQASLAIKARPNHQLTVVSGTFALVRASPIQNATIRIPRCRPVPGGQVRQFAVFLPQWKNAQQTRRSIVSKKCLSAKPVFAEGTAFRDVALPLFHQ